MSTHIRSKPLSLNTPSPSGRGQGEGHLKQFSRHLRTHSTDAERKVWSLLRDRRFLNLKFRRQYAIPPYIVDFCCVEILLIIEIDGGQHQGMLQKDLKREAALKSFGFHTIRFWNHDVLQNTADVLEKMHQTILSLPPHPNPLPQGEGKTFPCQGRSHNR